jgi:hypothetical protein
VSAKNTLAYIAWNPFQVVQFQNIRDSLGGTLVVIDRGENMVELKRSSIADQLRSAEIVHGTDVGLLDGCYDAVFFQAPFPQIENFSRSNLISVQYGLAKERHNYGEWRALADMNLMYGEYSARATQHFGPSYAVGNPKMAGWDFEKNKSQRPSIEARIGLDATKKTILYMPTYGELGSFDALINTLGKLATKYNILVKMHHNNDVRYANWEDVAKDAGIKHRFHGDADQQELLSLADLVVSDFSGAILDAVYAQVPVVLFQPDATALVGVQKFDLSSLEFRRREEIGIVSKSIDDFAKCVSDALQHGDELVQAYQPLRTELYLDGREHDTIALIRDYTDKLLDGKIPELTAAQKVVRETVQALRSIQVENSRLKRGAPAKKSWFRRP